MAGQITLWGAGQLLNTFFSQTVEPPQSFYLALVLDVAPTPFISGAELDEPTLAEYGRVEIPNDAVTWTNDGQIQVMMCEADLSFVTAIDDWGTIRYWAVCNAPVDGNIYFIGSFDDPEVISAGDTAVVSAGNLSVSVGPFFSEEE